MKPLNLIIVSIFFILINIGIFRNSINKYNYEQPQITEKANYEFEEYLWKYIKKCDDKYILKYTEDNKQKTASFSDYSISVPDLHGNTRVGFLLLKEIKESEVWWAKKEIPMVLTIDSIGIQTIQTFFDDPEEVHAALAFFESKDFACSSH